jgi:predicted phage replisome organizer
MVGKDDYMAEVKWIKITTTMFDDEKIKLIEKMPEGTSILLIWIKLLTLAGKCNATGQIYLSEDLAYTDEMLSIIFNMPLSTVRLALQTFNQFGMVDISESHVIKIVNWEKHQNIQGLDKIREQNRLRNQRYRENQKQLPNVTVTSHDAIDKNKNKSKK